MSETQKNISIEKISKLLENEKTDDGTFSGSLYDLYVLIKIAKGVADINHGNGMTLEESRERMMRKYENYNTKYGS